MAVFNDYVNTIIQAGGAKPVSPLEGQGTNVKAGRVVFDTVAAHDAASIYRVLHAIPSTAVIKKLHIYTDGVTGMDDVNVTIRKTLEEGGAEIGSEVLGSAIDLSSAVTSLSPKDGMVNIANADRGKPLWELAGQTLLSRTRNVDICLESVSDLSEADTIVVDFEFFFP